MRTLFTGRRALVLAALAVVAMAGGAFMMTKMTAKPDAADVAKAIPAKRPPTRPPADAAPAVPQDSASLAAGVAPLQEGVAVSPRPDGAAAGGSAAAEPAPADLAMAQATDAAPGALPAMATEEDVFKRRKYTYKSLGRTDPFVSLIAGTSADLEQLDPQTLKLVGVLEKGGSRRALVEDARGFGYILHRGDPVARGIVDEVGPDFLVITHSMYGITETVTLTLRSKEQGRSPNGSLN